MWIWLPLLLLDLDFVIAWNSTYLNKDLYYTCIYIPVVILSILNCQIADGETRPVLCSPLVLWYARFPGVCRNQNHSIQEVCPNGVLPGPLQGRNGPEIPGTNSVTGRKWVCGDFGVFFGWGCRDDWKSDRWGGTW